MRLTNNIPLPYTMLTAAVCSLVVAINEDPRPTPAVTVAATTIALTAFIGLKVLARTIQKNGFFVSITDFQQDAIITMGSTWLSMQVFMFSKDT